MKDHRVNAVLTAFAASPDRGRALARDFRVRWALEEVGRAYDVRLVSFADLKAPPHLALQPFGQIPTWQEDELTLFESGAIVLHIVDGHSTLLPPDTTSRARAVMWIFAALNTVEPPIWDWDLARMVERDKPWYSERMPLLETRVRERLSALSAWLGDKDWLEGDFTAGDLMMVTVLRRLQATTLLDEHASLVAYVARGEARPAFMRAFAAQKAVSDASQPISNGAPEKA